MPLVSVVMPSYHESFISTSIERALQQGLDDFELFIVANASIDASRHIIEGYATKERC